MDACEVFVRVVKEHIETSKTLLKLGVASIDELKGDAEKLLMHLRSLHRDLDIALSELVFFMNMLEEGDVDKILSYEV